MGNDTAPDMSGVPVVNKLMDALVALELDDTQEVRRLVRESIKNIHEAAAELRVNAEEMLAVSDRVREERDEARGENEDLRQALQDYAAHSAWRCEYRTRYEKCQCGLDDLMTELGLPLIPPNDPEARKD